MSSKISAGSGAQTPDDSSQVTVGDRAEEAGGSAAILSTLHELRRNDTGLLRGMRTLLQVNQPEGVDCPGCAWPESAGERSEIEFCENGAKAVSWETTRRRIDADFFARHSVAELAAGSDYQLGQLGRLTEPLYLPPGGTHYQPIAWDAAYRLIADELGSLSSPHEAAFYTSGRTSNEAAFLFQLLVRQLGTNNLPDCANLCHESSGVALKETVGVGKGTVQLDDFEQADAIFILGQNPGTNHPRMMAVLQKAAQRGCQIVAVNPLPEAALLRFAHPQSPLELLGGGTAITSLFLPVRIDGDAALLKGIMKELLDEERKRPGQVFDWEFIREHTGGIDELLHDLDAVTWDEVVTGSGLTRAQVRAAAAVWLRSRRIIACWAMGLTQHKAAVATIQQVVNLLLLGGHIGRPGAGLCPVRGHSNVQGDRTMGITPKIDDGFRQRLSQHFGFVAPSQPGLDTVGTIEALQAGRLRLLFSLGGNFLSATPDTEVTAAALRRCPLTVHVSTKLHRGHLGFGLSSLILPCLGRTERDVQASGPQFVTVENSMSVVHRSQGQLTPASPQLRSEVAIVCELAAAVLGRNSRVPWLTFRDNYDLIRDAIAATIPGFDHFNERVRGGDGFVLPNSARERSFVTSSERAQFTVAPLPQHPLLPGQLLMMTIRTHDQFNTTIYGLDDRYRGVYGGRRVILMNEADLHSRGLSPKQLVDLTSHFDGQTRTAERFVVVPYDIPLGCTATYFPETNVLVPLGSRADKSRTPTSKSVVITVQPSATQ
jgi:molybdopterin-dependent oxidoreductase alpha subunit